ncbi:MAG: outer membrane lipoprotein-sorting protein [Verrucomicrobiales bacterium]|nr:outer membrane lipoprotein-sorting protein [Verrucomicrobiales bacterium]
MSLRFVYWAALLRALFAAYFCLSQTTGPLAQPEKPDSKQFDAEARQLVRDILVQVPARPTSLEGVMKIRDASGKRTAVPLQYTIAPEEGGWRCVYETRSTPWRGAERLVIIHRDHRPNEYVHSPAGGPGEAPKPAVALRGDQAAIPFAGSDYWLADLGMEFLHWPEQRLVRDAKIKMRLSRPCKVVESTNPNPAATNYRRVISWLDAESGAPIYAEGFDAKGEQVKTFSLHGLTKANGQWLPKEFEMLTDRTDTKTQIEFAFEPR